MRWLPRRPGRRPHGAAPRPRPTARLHLEVLEGREVPAVLYYGGNLLPHVEAQALYLGNEWSSVPAYAGQAATVDSFLTALTGGAYMDALTRAGYNVGRGSASPGAVDGVGLSAGSTITDDFIQARIQADIDAGVLAAPDANRLYLVYAEPDVAVDLGGGQGTTQQGILGYHGAFGGHDAAGRAATIRYAVVAYPGGSAGNSSLGTSAIDQLTDVSSHELAEAVTDPDVDYARAGWYDPRRGEIADVTENNPSAYVRLDGYLVQEVADQNDRLLSVFPAAATTTTLFASADSFMQGQAVTLTATVSASGVGGPPGGTVLFEDGTTVLGSATLDAGGHATLTTTALGPGAHSLTAVYTGAAGFAASTSAPVAVQVTPSPYAGLALNYLSAGATFAYGGYVYGSHSAYAYQAYVYSAYAQAYAQAAASTGSATYWYDAYFFAGAAQNAAYADYATTGDVYGYYAFYYEAYGSAFASYTYALPTG